MKHKLMAIVSVPFLLATLAVPAFAAETEIPAPSVGVSVSDTAVPENPPTPGGSSSEENPPVPAPPVPKPSVPKPSVPEPSAPVPSSNPKVSGAVKEEVKSSGASSRVGKASHSGVVKNFGVKRLGKKSVDVPRLADTGANSSGFGFGVCFAFIGAGLGLFLARRFHVGSGF